MPKIEHVAIWVSDLERSKDFYCRYFHGTPGQRYHNPTKNFTSCFIEFDDATRLELMHKPGLQEGKELLGYAHVAFSVGSREMVNSITEIMRIDKIPVLGEPRTTGDGYYESVVSDPDGNPVEITI